MTLACSVYVIEDDDTVARSLAVLLQVHRYQVLRFRSAIEFVECVDDLPPGCVLMDYSLPGMNGLEAVRELTHRGYKWPVIMLTGYDVQELAAEARQLGICGMVEKPFDINTLIRELEGPKVIRALRAAPAQSKSRSS